MTPSNLEALRDSIRSCWTGVAREQALAALEELEYMQAANVALAAGAKLLRRQLDEERELRANLRDGAGSLQVTVRDLLAIVAAAAPYLTADTNVALKAMTARILAAPNMKELS